MTIGLGIVLASLAIWLGLFCFWGQFWRTDRFLQDESTPDLAKYPAVCAIVPARNEAELLPVTLRSLLAQDYPGDFSIVLVDDQSTDGTAEVARSLDARKIHILTAEALPPGWKGKLWAIEQGIRYAQNLALLPDYILLTDADIEHDRANLRQLVAKAEGENLELVSLMVQLRCQSFWESLLIPAFVFFFQKLYPFGWVNDPLRRTAAAAGGCILIRRETLSDIGGIQVIREALIDDCALAAAVKSRRKSKIQPSPPGPLDLTPSPSPARRGETGERREDKEVFGKGIWERSHLATSTGRIWLGLTSSTRSLRPYDSLTSIWDMVARSAYAQLNYSPWMLLGTLIGMTAIYLVPPVGIVAGLLFKNWPIAIASLISYLLMTVAYWPTVRFYRRSPLLAFCLPAIAFLYTLMTLDSAWRYYRGRGGAWKGRVYSKSKVKSQKPKE